MMFTKNCPLTRVQNSRHHPRHDHHEQRQNLCERRQQGGTLSVRQAFGGQHSLHDHLHDVMYRLPICISVLIINTGMPYLYNLLIPFRWPEIRTQIGIHLSDNTYKSEACVNRFQPV